MSDFVQLVLYVASRDATQVVLGKCFDLVSHLTTLSARSVPNYRTQGGKGERDERLPAVTRVCSTAVGVVPHHTHLSVLNKPRLWHLPGCVQSSSQRQTESRT